MSSKPLRHRPTNGLRRSSKVITIGSTHLATGCHLVRSDPLPPILSRSEHVRDQPSSPRGSVNPVSPSGDYGSYLVQEPASPPTQSPPIPIGGVTYQYEELLEIGLTDFDTLNPLAIADKDADNLGNALVDLIRLEERLLARTKENSAASSNFLTDTDAAIFKELRNFLEKQASETDSIPKGSPQSEKWAIWDSLLKIFPSDRFGRAKIIDDHDLSKLLKMLAASRKEDNLLKQGSRAIMLFLHQTILLLYHYHKLGENLPKYTELVEKKKYSKRGRQKTSEYLIIEGAFSKHDRAYVALYPVICKLRSSAINWLQNSGFFELPGSDFEAGALQRNQERRGNQSKTTTSSGKRKRSATRNRTGSSDRANRGSMIWERSPSLAEASGTKLDEADGVKRPIEEKKTMDPFEKLMKRMYISVGHVRFHIASILKSIERVPPARRPECTSPSANRLSLGLMYY